MIKLIFKIKLNHKFASSGYGQDRKRNKDEGQDAYGRVGWWNTQVPQPE